ncbi:hypothetical protein PR202_gb26467 [Eleusine coracana subsp. coracana]|uniref:Uncharacterized protein n=1 Tax=Eleusine coracana subsp. coracana TaxID=191504 RepID=A0AAV5FSR2_ELECO|nr:hypothetical protein QOZ80_1BG0058130 [Eleusine coracana subsp. coracana]GJN37500.1 hypothetical protein PR202_gb26467 [Eleusine coracana subsp. coracana]
MDFDEYLRLQQSSFVQYYRCLPTSYVNNGHIDEDGNKGVVMPPSALDRLSSLEIEFPMKFRIQNPATGRASHIGVLEFVAEEGFIHIPAWLMTRLGLAEHDLVLVQQKALPKATFLKLQAHTMDFTLVSNPRELLEYNFHKYACLTAGETITVTEGDKRFYLDVVETKPEDAVCVIETDCEVDFATPLDYVDPPPQPAAPAETVPSQFTGVAGRMDGKPVEQPKPPAPASRAAPGGSKPKGGLRFGGGASKGKQEGGGAKEPEQQKFTGTPYSLQ